MAEDQIKPVFEIEGTQALITELEQYGQAVEAAGSLVVRKYVRRIERSIKEKIRRPGSGRVYQRGGVTHQASAPGEPPASDTGDLISSIRSAVRGLQGRIVADEDYAVYLELGAPKINLDPRPFFEPSVEEHEEDFVRDLKRLIDNIK